VFDDLALTSLVEYSRAADTMQKGAGQPDAVRDYTCCTLHALDQRGHCSRDRQAGTGDLTINNARNECTQHMLKLIVDVLSMF
jgi:hypothetical protein